MVNIEGNRPTWDAMRHTKAKEGLRTWNPERSLPDGKRYLDQTHALEKQEEESEESEEHRTPLCGTRNP